MNTIDILGDYLCPYAIICLVPTYSVHFEIKLKLLNALKPDYRIPAISVS